MEKIFPKPSPIEISAEEIEILNDIRKIEFGKISLKINNGTVVSKEITNILKIKKNLTNSGLICGKGWVGE